MELRQQIDEDLKAALKSKDTLRVSVLRLLKSALTYKEIEKQGKLSNEDVVAVLDKEVKKRGEAVEAYRGRRDDLADKEQKEMEILTDYLPERLGDEEIERVVAEVVSEAGEGANVGKVMGQVMGRLKGQRVDGKRVRELVESKLKT